MSDCSRRAWMVAEPNVIYTHPLYSRKMYEDARAIVVRFGDGGEERFDKVGKCVMAKTLSGHPCSDYECSACGKIHCAPRVHSFCPRCGSRVEGVADLTGNDAGRPADG